MSQETIENKVEGKKILKLEGGKKTQKIQGKDLIYIILKTRKI